MSRKFGENLHSRANITKKMKTHLKQRIKINDNIAHQIFSFTHTFRTFAEILNNDWQ